MPLPCKQPAGLIQLCSSACSSPNLGWKAMSKQLWALSCCPLSTQEMSVSAARHRSTLSTQKTLLRPQPCKQAAGLTQLGSQVSQPLQAGTTEYEFRSLPQPSKEPAGLVRLDSLACSHLHLGWQWQSSEHHSCWSAQKH